MSTKKSCPGLPRTRRSQGEPALPGRQTFRSSPTDTIVPAIPVCRNCDYILDRCEINDWRPRALCNACAAGNCYEEPPPPDPFPNPFGPLPRF